MTTDRPIIYSAPMVRALLDGRKTMTRRLAWRWRLHDDGTGRSADHGRTVWQKVQPGDRLWVREAWRPASWDEDGDFWIEYVADGKRSEAFYNDDTDDLSERVCAELDRRGVKIDENGYYELDDDTKPRIRSPIHMPRWASRMTQIVTAVKIERLQDISEADAIAEGLKGLTKDGRLVKYGIPDSDGLPGRDDIGWAWEHWNADPRVAYRHLWEQIHGAGSWDANPFVVALTFETHQVNIDAMP